MSADEEGMTLIEVVIALMVLSLGIVAVVSAMTVLAAATYTTHEGADVGATLRTAVERVQASGYVPCTTGNPLSSYNAVAQATPVTIYNSSADVFAPTVVAVNGPTGTTLGSSCSTDPGLQEVEVTDVSSDHRVSETLWVLKRNS
ncbi:MAG: PilW family protein [Acidimicrobiales bacterium]